MHKTLDDFKDDFPNAWAAYENLRNTCDHDGPLDKKTVELIKVGIAAAQEHEGSLVSHVSQAQKAGASPGEIYHAVLQATGIAGFTVTLHGMRTAKTYIEQ
ncbi:carboxymuconolactone decarboxylase family protein [Thiohalomonas denitrificans]|uniref:Alkylhydroperoxidase AhpD family core domain-containing protein n=1 Tax=Thiohalomonas denitrificans TaxID=415747 RepID=A0A1G5QKA4_9GAMM|nr:carboxymuconolactone decarboxylase family protein [Thiohalomonas denitrificans]SCZ62254.1 alkylhydroperoxidase AhpD family core domain-containing protein [Thiohalomonas denitrificans]